MTITIPHDNKRWLQRQPWLQVHRTRHPDQVLLASTMVTSLPRMVIDHAALLTDFELTALVLRVIQQGRVSAEGLQELLDHLGRRPGSARMRRVLRDYEPGHESHLNKALWEIVCWAGYPEAEMGFSIRIDDDTEVSPDTVLQRVRQGFEADGTKPHSSLRQIKHDKWKDRQLAALGWANARFTTEDVLRWKRQTRREIQGIVGRRELELRRSA